MIMEIDSKLDMKPRNSKQIAITQNAEYEAAIEQILNVELIPDDSYMKIRR